MKKCNKCGAQNPDIYNFCSSCGQKLEVPTVTPSQPQYVTTTTVTSNQTQYVNNSTECQITFKRPNAFLWMGSKYHIKIDGIVSYEVANDGSITVPLTPGLHSVEISVFAIPKKKKFSFQANGNMTFICNPNPAAAVTYLAAPIKVTDSNGREY